MNQSEQIKNLTEQVRLLSMQLSEISARTKEQDTEHTNSINLGGIDMAYREFQETVVEATKSYQEVLISAQSKLIEAVKF